MNNQLKTVLLLGLLSVFFIWLGSLFGPGMFYSTMILALVMNVGGYFFSDKLVLAMSGAKEVSPEEAPALHRMVAALAVKANIPKPRVCVIPADYANAFATGRNPKHGVVAVTQGILRALPERELRGVIAHEIGHIMNRDILIATIAAVIASAISSMAHMVQWAAIFGGGRDREDNSPLVSIAVAIIAPIAAMILQFAISRSREYVADQTGAKLTGDPEALASALERLHGASKRIPAHVSPATASLYIVNPLAGMPSVFTLFSTHPPVEKRISRLMEFAKNPLALKAT